MTAESSSRSRFEALPWLLVLAGVGVIVALGAFMSRVRDPVLRGEFTPAEVSAIVAAIHSARGAAARCDELKRSSPTMVTALVIGNPTRDALYEVVTLRLRDDRWQVVSANVWK